MGPSWNFSKKIIAIESTGFLVLIAILWMDEILDLPHLIFRAPPTLINIQESIIESVLVLLLATLVILATHRLLRRIQRLEGILPICSFCKKIRSGSEWIPVDYYIAKHTEADISHGLCPDCAKKYYGHIVSTTEKVT